MKTNRINLTSLRNEEHYQLLNSVQQLIEQLGAKDLNIVEIAAIMGSLNKNELEALQVLRKSANSKLIEDADDFRDSLFRGFSDSVASSLNHFDAIKQEAGRKLWIVLEQYGNVGRKPFNVETADIIKLVKECTTTFASEIELLNLTDWVSELAVRNQAFDTLMKSRYSEEADKTTLRMKQVRKDADIAFRQMLKRIDALLLIDNPANYATFVRELNARINNYNHIIAVRQGKNTTNETTPPIMDERMN